MEFEFDPNKSATNKTKHDIDFIEAQKLWNDIHSVEIPARTTDETRFLVIDKTLAIFIPKNQQILISFDNSLCPNCW